MEKGLEHLRKIFELGETDIRTYSALPLAYVGDAVYELVIRTVLVEKGNTSVYKLNQRASKLVRASAQAEMIERLKPCLTEEEFSIYKRGRNAKPASIPKHASVTDYKRATGFEALLGYLYLTNQGERMLELIQKGITEGEEDGKEIPGK